MLLLKTRRLVLRDFRADEFDAFYATTNDPDYRQFYSEREMAPAFWQALFGRFRAAQVAAERNTYQLAVCLPDGVVIGTCGVRIEDREHQQASFGCAIARASWGQGYGYEASRRILDFGFSSLPVHRIYAETIAENARARALAERLGMRLEGELRHHRFFQGRWWDTALYAILKEEWGPSG